MVATLDNFIEVVLGYSELLVFHFNEGWSINKNLSALLKACWIYEGSFLIIIQKLQRILHCVFDCELDFPIEFVAGERWVGSEFVEVAGAARRKAMR